MKESDTQQKIKEAADQLFMHKGYEATRVRDIAELAGVNLALVNYHFGSKENLFMIIMQEKVQSLFVDIIPVFTDDTITLEDKLDIMVEKYINVVSTDHNLPIFIFSELSKQDGKFAEVVPVDMIKNSSILMQIKERQPDVNPMHYVLNLLGMAFFPYIIGPTIIKAGITGRKELEKMMKERIKLVPAWGKLIINGKIK